MNILIRKLIYRAWHRGTKELDLVLGNFAESKIHEFSQSELHDFTVILDEEDPDLYQWLINNQNPADHINADIINRIRDYINANNISYY
jgi:antitoxin CptB